MLQIIGSIASIVAAVTSIVLFVYFVWDRHHRLRIRVAYNLVEISAQGESKEKMLSVEVTNLGTRAVALDKAFLYGPEEKLAILKDSLRDRPEKVLTPENPSITFFAHQENLEPRNLIGIIVYDRRGNPYIRHLQPRGARVKRWCRLRFTAKGRESRNLLKKLNVGGL